MSSRKHLLASSTSLSSSTSSSFTTRKSSPSFSFQFRCFAFLSLVSLGLLLAYSFLFGDSYRSSSAVSPRGTLMSTTGCKILDFDPFHPSIVHFIDKTKERRLLCPRPKKSPFLVRESERKGGKKNVSVGVCAHVRAFVRACAFVCLLVYLLEREKYTDGQTDHQFAFYRR